METFFWERSSNNPTNWFFIIHCVSQNGTSNNSQLCVQLSCAESVCLADVYLIRAQKSFKNAKYGAKMSDQQFPDFHCGRSYSFHSINKGKSSEEITNQKPECEYCKSYSKSSRTEKRREKQSPSGDWKSRGWVVEGINSIQLCTFNDHTYSSSHSCSHTHTHSLTTTQRHICKCVNISILLLG